MNTWHRPLVLLCAAVLATIALPCAAFASGEVSDADALQSEMQALLDEGEQLDAEANSWRYVNGDRILVAQNASAAPAVTPLSAAAYSAASGASSWATWSRENGTSSYTWKSQPTDAGQTVAVPGVLRVGVDVSGWQGAIDWARVKADGISFAIIRCGSYSSSLGKHVMDPFFLQNVQGAKKYGIEIGVYLYSYASAVTGDQSSESEATNVLSFLEAAGLTSSDMEMPVYYDLEDSSQAGFGAAKLGQMAKTFCDIVSSKGYSVGIYANRNWWTNYLTDPVFANENWYNWVASYPGSGKMTSSGWAGTQMWQFSDCGSVNGIDGYVDMNFDYVGHYEPYGRWLYEDGEWYWINDRGERITGWLHYDNAWYYLGEGGVMVTGWQDIEGARYFFDASGAMQTGWLEDGKNWYYLRSSGAMATGWVLSGSSWYWMDEDGAMSTGWIQDQGTWYYLDGAGVMYTGWLKQGSTWYYLESSGAMAEGWRSLGGVWYWFYPELGAMATGWAQDGATWYYLDTNGAMQTGWLKDGGSWYYLQPSGAMATGWVKVGGSWYYLAESGAMATGWLLDGGAWYWLDRETGAMAVNTVIDGYRVGADGKWIS